MQKINTTDGVFHDGNANNGELGTIVSADWLNSVQGELTALVEGYGASLDPASKDQIAKLLLKTQAAGDNSTKLATTAFVQGGLQGHKGEVNPHTQYAPIASPSFTGTPLAPTPEQFDYSTKVATTGFVQRALGNYQIGQQIGNSTVLTSADCGKVFQLAASNAITVTLPSVTAVPQGGSLTFFSNTPSPTTLVVQGSDRIIASLTSLPSLTVPGGECLTLVRTDPFNWFVVSGSMHSPYSTMSASVKTRNGYQKLPSGLIIQWGEILQQDTGNSAVPFTFYLPISFPNAALQASITQGNWVSGAVANHSIEALYNGAIFGFTWASAASRIYRIIAIGY